MTVGKVNKYVVFKHTYAVDTKLFFAQTVEDAIYMKDELSAKDGERWSVATVEDGRLWRVLQWLVRRCRA